MKDMQQTILRVEDIAGCCDEVANSPIRTPMDFANFMNVVRQPGLYRLIPNVPHSQGGDP